MDKIFNFGVIGVGVIGNYHLQAIANQENVRAIAIADIKEEALKLAAEKFKIEKCFTDYHDLLDLDEIDGVIVATPPFNHAEITCEAASAGKHVLCEKPMALNSKEAAKMVEECKKAGVKLGICSSRRRVTPQIELAKQYISDGKLGQIYYARFVTLRRRGRPGIDILKSSKWFLDSARAGGGALIDIGCYDIDALLYLIGGSQPLSVSAMTFRGINGQYKIETKYDVEEHSSVFVRFNNGLVASFETAWATNVEPSQEALIFGSKGGLRLTRFGSFTYFGEENGRVLSLSYDLGRLSMVAINGLLISDFVKACLEDTSPKTSGEEGLKVMQIIDMAYKSAKLNREVRIDEI